MPGSCFGSFLSDRIKHCGKNKQDKIAIILVAHKNDITTSGLVFLTKSLIFFILI